MYTSSYVEILEKIKMKSDIKSCNICYGVMEKWTYLYFFNLFIYLLGQKGKTVN